MLNARTNAKVGRASFIIRDQTLKSFSTMESNRLQSERDRGPASPRRNCRPCVGGLDRTLARNLRCKRGRMLTAVDDGEFPRDAIAGVVFRDEEINTRCH